MNLQVEYGILEKAGTIHLIFWSRIMRKKTILLSDITFLDRSTLKPGMLLPRKTHTNLRRYLIKWHHMKWKHSLNPPVISSWEWAQSQFLLRPNSSPVGQFSNGGLMVVFKAKLFEHSVRADEILNLISCTVEVQKQRLPWARSGATIQQSGNVLWDQLLHMMAAGDHQNWVAKEFLSNCWN